MLLGLRVYEITTGTQPYEHVYNLVEVSEREVHIIFTLVAVCFLFILMKQPLCRNRAGGIDNVYIMNSKWPKNQGLLDL